MEVCGLLSSVASLLVNQRHMAGGANLIADLKAREEYHEKAAPVSRAHGKHELKSEPERRRP